MSMNNPQNYMSHCLNNCSTKQSFTFSKSKRKGLAKKILNHSIYNINSHKSHRATSFGFGNKTQIGDKSFSPPPNSYHLPSSFSERMPKAKTFGDSRNQVKFGSFLPDSQIGPGPNAYQVKLIKMNRRGGKMGIKLPSDLDNLKKKCTPGPGSYNLSSTEFQNSGSYFLAKHTNNRYAKMHESTAKIYDTQNKRKMKTEIGPGSYEVTYGNLQKSMLSKFRNSVSGSFGKSQRSSVEDKSKMGFPGFKYKRFSDFGDY